MLKFLGRLLNLNDTPERIAFAFAIGVFLAFSPLLGLHTFLGLTLAFLFGLNRVAVLVGLCRRPSGRVSRGVQHAGLRLARDAAQQFLASSYRRLGSDQADRPRFVHPLPRRVQPLLPGRALSGPEEQGEAEPAGCLTRFALAV
jgi:hypothetical protein